MLLCIAARGGEPTVVISQWNFATDTYVFDGIFYSREEAISQPDRVIDGYGLSVPQTGDAILNLVTDLTNFLTNQDFTVVVRWAQGGSGYGLPFTVFNSPTIAPTIFVEDDRGNDRIRLHDLWNFSRILEVSPHPGTEFHCMALSRTDSKVSMSLDGGDVQTDTNFQTGFQGVADTVGFGGDVQSYGDCLIQSVEIRGLVEDGILPGLSSSPITFVPSNNDFENATTITSGETLIGHSIGADFEIDEPGSPWGSDGQSVWWKFTAPSTGDYTVSTLGSSITDAEILITIFTGSSVDDLTLVEYNEFEPFTEVTFSATMGTTYYFSIDGFGPVSGLITISVNPEDSS